MQLADVSAARLLVQTVDVLRYDGVELPDLFELRERLMRLVRLRVGIDQKLFVIIEEDLGVVLKKVDGQNF